MLTSVPVYLRFTGFLVSAIILRLEIMTVCAAFFLPRLTIFLSHILTP